MCVSDDINEIECMCQYAKVAIDKICSYNLSYKREEAASSLLPSYNAIKRTKTVKVIYSHCIRSLLFVKLLPLFLTQVLTQIHMIFSSLKRSKMVSAFCGDSSATSRTKNIKPAFKRFLRAFSLNFFLVHNRGFCCPLKHTV